MRKLKNLAGVLFIILAIAACDKKSVELVNDPLEATSSSGILAIPYGGNTSCEELTDFPLAFSSGRVNYQGGTFAFESPSTGWPEGLTVVVAVDGSVSFTYESDLYCVGAVIVKGGNASNVFRYTPGVKSDNGLFAPVNASGSPAALSNITFCFVECSKVEPLVVAIKSQYFFGEPNDYYKHTWAVNSGTYIFSGSSGWCKNQGIISIPVTSHIDILNGNTMEDVGDIVITTEGQVTITLKSGLTLDKTFVYVGTESALLNSAASNGCPDSYDTNTNGWTTIEAPNNSNEQTFVISI